MNIYVGNLAWKTRQKELKELFENFGEVTNAFIVRDKVTRRSRGFGFVEMAEEKDARQAIEKLNNTVFLDRTIIVNEALPKGDDSSADDSADTAGEKKTDAESGPETETVAVAAAAEDKSGSVEEEPSEVEEKLAGEDHKPEGEVEKTAGEAEKPAEAEEKPAEAEEKPAEAEEEPAEAEKEPAEAEEEPAEAEEKPVKEDLQTAVEKEEADAAEPDADEEKPAGEEETEDEDTDKKD